MLITRRKTVCLIFVTGKDSCGGDSGGPMTYRHSVNDPWYLVGLVSYGSTKCGDKPGVYTYVPHYIGWIRRTLRE